MRDNHTRFGWITVFLALALIAIAPSLQTPHSPGGAKAYAQQQGAVPGQSLGNTSDADFWRMIRSGGAGTKGGIQGSVSIPDKKAGMLVQSEGEQWRSIRNGPLKTYGAYALGGMVLLLVLFFLIRGRVKIEAGLSGRLIERFTTIERAAHWLTASSFILLGVTGLNLLFGKHVLLPVVGPSIFGVITYYGKISHNFIGFAFMVGIVLMFVMWVVHNIPSRHDLVWLAKGGGLIGKGHPPAKKFNAGQKVIFWTTVGGGAVLSWTGLQLMFPFGGILSFALATSIFDMQLIVLIHSILAVVMVCVIIAHIYIGTIGMEGAFDAMGSGYVDENWAHEHHSIWLDEVKNEAGEIDTAKQPAE